MSSGLITLLLGEFNQSEGVSERLISSLRACAMGGLRVSVLVVLVVLVVVVLAGGSRRVAGSHGVPWDPMRPMGPMGSHGIPWDPMGPMGSHGIPWDPTSPMGCHGTPWDPM